MAIIGRHRPTAPEGIITTPPSNNGDEVSDAVDDEHLVDIDTKIWGADEASIIGTTPRIPFVPLRMRNSPSVAMVQWVEPRIISIGPYHHGGGLLNLLADGQKLKDGHAQQFINESGQTRDDLYQKIRLRAPELRTWYDVYAIRRHSDDKLANIFLLDGCFILNFINYRSKEDGLNNLDLIKRNNIKQDLFLLQNQLPYEVLKLLFEDAKPSNPSMEEKIKDFVESQAPFRRGKWAKQVNHSPSHLLHYLHDVLLGEPKTISPPQGQHKEEKKSTTGRRRAPLRSCRTVQDLMEVGIRFEPSDTSYLTDISFEHHNLGTTGCLKLPSISMKIFTMITFLNLAALESTNTTDNLGVTSYLCFMDSLVDSWDDVKELQAAGILRNFVGEPKAIAQFFNIACSNLVPNPSAYKDVRLRIERHAERHNNSRLLTWYVQCREKYFSSPWSFIALIAAIIGLSLTAIQTFNSLFPQ